MRSCGSTGARCPRGEPCINRNIAIWGNTLIDGSADNQVYAVDVHTGNMVWDTKVMEAKARACARRARFIGRHPVGDQR